MNLTFELALLQDCVLRIKDTSYNEYLPEDAIDYVREKYFKYSDTYTVNIIKYKSVSKEEIVDVIFSEHTTDLDETYYQLKKDGHYIIQHIVMPSTECYNRLLSEDNSILNGYTLRYATDGQQFYKYDNLGNASICDVEEISMINADADSTISKVQQDTFSVCYLHNCYLNLCNKQFDKLIKNRCQTNSERNFDLDLIWMAINAIKYNIEFGDAYLDAAQAILEDVTRCNTACSQTTKSNNYGCQCCG